MATRVAETGRFNEETDLMTDRDPHYIDAYDFDIPMPVVGNPRSQPLPQPQPQPQRAATAPSSAPPKPAPASPKPAVAVALMAKMGYVHGAGLGARGTGVAQPIVAAGNAGHAGLGAKKRQPLLSRDLTLADMKHYSPAHTPATAAVCCTAPAAEFVLTPVVKEGAPALDLSQTVRHLHGLKNKFEQYADALSAAVHSANPYEYKLGLGLLNRAGAKIAEILAAFGIGVPADVASVAGGPGAMEQMLFYLGGKDVRVTAMSLRCPGIHGELSHFNYAVSRETATADIPSHGFVECAGDGTGDILTPFNQHMFRSKVLERSKGCVGLFMADGGSDVKEHNAQETELSHLLVAQVLAGLSVLRRDGAFVCKLFGTSSHVVQSILYVLYAHFEKFCIYKPHTSRPANDERFVVCTGYRPVAPATLDAMSHILLVLYANKEMRLHSLVPQSALNPEFVAYMRARTDALALRQIDAVKCVFRCLDNPSAPPLWNSYELVLALFTKIGLLHCWRQYAGAALPPRQPRVGASKPPAAVQPPPQIQIQIQTESLESMKWRVRLKHEGAVADTAGMSAAKRDPLGIRRAAGAALQPIQTARARLEPASPAFSPRSPRPSSLPSPHPNTLLSPRLISPHAPPAGAKCMPPPSARTIDASTTQPDSSHSLLGSADRKKATAESKRLREVLAELRAAGAAKSATSGTSPNADAQADGDGDGDTSDGEAGPVLLKRTAPLDPASAEYTRLLKKVKHGLFL